jgi:hypothetical protein
MKTISSINQLEIRVNWQIIVKSQGHVVIAERSGGLLIGIFRNQNREKSTKNSHEKFGIN